MTTTIETLRAAKTAADTAVIAFNFVNTRASGFSHYAHSAARQAACEVAFAATHALNAALAAVPRVKPAQAECEAFARLSSESVAAQSAAFLALPVGGYDMADMSAHSDD